MRISRVRLLCAAILITLLAAPSGWGRSRLEVQPAPADLPAAAETWTLDPSELRFIGVHNAGDIYTVIGEGLLSYGFLEYRRDPETGESVRPITYPRDSFVTYTWGGALWIGGLIDDDTVVSVAADGWFTYVDELRPENLARGGTHRIGRYADDEFVTVMVDTGITPAYDQQRRGLGLKVTQTSYSWSDTLYDDFIILEYLVENIGSDFIQGGCVGFYLDHDISHASQSSGGYRDDCSNVLDTLLYDDDPASRTLISYSIDNDGDPSADSGWVYSSARGIISLRLLHSDFDVEFENFNWWVPHGVPGLDFGPRRLGTPEDPLRLFANNNIGTAINDSDKYYIMVHPEIDYATMEIAAVDSADGWLPVDSLTAWDHAYGLDTRYLHSLGPFDLAPGESVSFAFALVGARDVHVDPYDFADIFDPLAPEIYQSRLDFSQLMINHRRADSVYRSGMLLPRPGAPVGLTIASYDDAYVDLSWKTGLRPDLAGYHLYLKDTLIDHQWRRVFPDMLTDTAVICPIMSADHVHFLAVSQVDESGRESALSFPVTVIPGAPHPPLNPAIFLDSLTPMLSWTPPVDTALLVYIIYRAIWNGDFELFDSTAALEYRDFNTESGTQYHYMVSAKNDLDVESAQVGPLTAVPMALDKGALLINRNVDHPSNLIAYKPEYVDRLYESVAALIPIRLLNDADEVTFKDLADHSPIIFDVESRSSNLWWPTYDWLRMYLEGGGKAVFILLSAASDNGNQADPVVNRFGEGNFFHDLLKLDSSVTNGMVIDYGDTTVIGDMSGCRSIQPNYASVTADTSKYEGPIFDVVGGVPMSGYLFPNNEAEPIYTYISNDPDTVNHGQINGLRYLGDDYAFVLLNFPLTLMIEPGSFHVLRQALADLGVNMNCGDVIDDGRTNLGDIIYLINYIFRDGAAPPNFDNADVNCDGAIDLADVVNLVNFMIRGEGWLKCCP